MRQRWLTAALIAGGLLLGGVAAVAFSSPEARAWVREFDILTVLRDMESTNRDMQTANTSLLVALEDVEDQVAQVEGLHARLLRLEGLLQQQTASLERLHGLTAEQARLSRDLTGLTQEALPAITGLADTAGAQSRAMRDMGKRTATMGGRLKAIRDLNLRMAGKLKQADTLADRILRLLLP